MILYVDYHEIVSLINMQLGSQSRLLISPVFGRGLSTSVDPVRPTDNGHKKRIDLSILQ